MAIHYRIDGNDVIAEVDEAWQAFALANDGELVLRERVLGREIWDFISGVELCALYRTLFARVRESGRRLELSYRCDSADRRRYLTLCVEAKYRDALQFTSTLLREEVRAPVPLIFTRDPFGSGQVIVICSMCKKIRQTPEVWAEVEDAVAALGLLEMDAPPGLSHGLCPACFQIARAAIDAC